jgi:hypothetical protein
VVSMDHLFVFKSMYLSGPFKFGAHLYPAVCSQDKRIKQWSMWQSHIMTHMETCHEQFFTSYTWVPEPWSINPYLYSDHLGGPDHGDCILHIGHTHCHHGEVVSDVVASRGTNPNHPELLHCQEVSPACPGEPLSCLQEVVDWLGVDSCQSHTMESPPMLSAWLEPSALKTAAIFPQKCKLKYPDYMKYENEVITLY